MRRSKSDAGTPADSEISALAQAIAGPLQRWFRANSRDLSWRRTRDPYAIWVSEIMLQQTRVETVERYYTDFLAKFPNVGALAAADEESVLGAWSGLGYYRRARLLHRGARHVASELGGEVPADPQELRKIPGIGNYTAGAISSIAFDRPSPLVDGNVARVNSRLLAQTDPSKQGADAKIHWRLVEAVLRRGTPRILAQAMMELGATVCTPKAPVCERCPVRPQCRAFATKQTTTIPAPRRRSESPTEVYVALGIVSRKRIALIRRPKPGLLAGMWCLPVVPSKSGAVDSQVRGVVDAKAEFEPVPGGVVRHVFTHRIWELHPVRCRVGARPPLVGYDVQWVAADQRPQGGIPSVTKKLLTRLGF